VPGKPRASGRATKGTRRRRPEPAGVRGRAPKPSRGGVGGVVQTAPAMPTGRGGGPKPPTRTRGAGRARAPPHRPATPIAARRMHLLERPRHPGVAARGAFLRGGCRAPADSGNSRVSRPRGVPPRDHPPPRALGRPLGPPNKAPLVPRHGPPMPRIPRPGQSPNPGNAPDIPPPAIPDSRPRNSPEFPRRRPPGRRPQGFPESPECSTTTYGLPAAALFRSFPAPKPPTQLAVVDLAARA